MPLDPFQPWLDRWRLTPDGPAFSTRFGSHLMPVLADGAAAMLKVAGGAEERRGAAVMAWWGGDGAAQVLAHEDPAVLLERALGRRSLAAMARGGEDDQATEIICDVAARLHRPRGGPWPPTLVPLPVWFEALTPVAQRHGGVFGKSAAAARELLNGPRDIVVLHGDLHHDNILDGEARGWLAIDPKGLIGERGFEYANLFRNPGADVALQPGRMARQVQVVAERADLAPARLLAWILAYAGLGAAWSLGSGHDADAAAGLAIAEMAAGLLGR